jgi:hypothetical protein
MHDRRDARWQPIGSERSAIGFARLNGHDAVQHFVVSTAHTPSTVTEKGV